MKNKKNSSSFLTNHPSKAPSESLNFFSPKTGSPTKILESTQPLSKSFEKFSKYNSDFLVEEVEEDIKKLDSSFAFQWDHELSFLYAVKCIKQATEKLLIEKHSATENFRKDFEKQTIELKKYENNLKIREKALEDFETSLKIEKNNIDCLYNKLNTETQKINQEKI